MNSYLSDTSPEAERILIEGYRKMTPRQKLERVVSMNKALVAMSTARIRATYGEDISDRELKLRLAALRLDREIMIKVFDWDPDKEGL